MFTWLFRLVVGAAVLSAALWVLRSGMKWWVDGPEVEPSTDPWPRLVEPPAPTGAPAALQASLAALDDVWVSPEEADDALTSHPVKAKESSRLYHLPGMLAYERTRPDRCYASAEAAEADGFVRAKR
jgi:hypothetical protein